MRWQMMAVAVVSALALSSSDASAQSLRRSPRETIEATIAGATFSLTYSRPYAQGRKIIGGLVPYGEIWRTGADEATSFQTSHNLEIQGVIIPAGAYTLFTIPGATEWTLIINTQTGQWGTVYEDGQDMARLLMIPELTAPVEQFTIAMVEIDETSGALTFAWETTLLTLAFTVK